MSEHYIVGGITMAVGTVLFILALSVVSQYKLYCDAFNNQQSIVDQIKNTSYVILIIGIIAFLLGLMMFYKKIRVFSNKTITYLVGLTGLIVLITAFIQDSQIKKIKCQDDASYDTLSHMNTGMIVMGVLLVVFSVVHYYFTREEPELTQIPKDGASKEPQISQEQLNKKKLEKFQKELDKALSSGASSETIENLEEKIADVEYEIEKASLEKLSKKAERRKSLEDIREKTKTIKSGRDEPKKDVKDFSRFIRDEQPRKLEFL